MCPILQMRRLKLRGITCPKSHSHLVADSGLKLKICSSYKPLLWNQGMVHVPRCHPASSACPKVDIKLYFPSWLVKHPWLENNLPTDKHLSSIYSKQSTVYIESLVSVFEEDSFFKTRHVTWRPEAKEKLRKQKTSMHSNKDRNSAGMRVWENWRTNRISLERGILEFKLL